MFVVCALTIGVQCKRLISDMVLQLDGRQHNGQAERKTLELCVADHGASISDLTARIVGLESRTKAGLDVGGLARRDDASVVSVTTAASNGVTGGALIEFAAMMDKRFSELDQRLRLEQLHLVSRLDHLEVPLRRLPGTDKSQTFQAVGLKAEAIARVVEEAVERALAPMWRQHSDTAGRLARLEALFSEANGTGHPPSTARWHNAVGAPREEHRSLLEKPTLKDPPQLERLLGWLETSTSEPNGGRGPQRRSVRTSAVPMPEARWHNTDGARWDEPSRPMDLPPFERMQPPEPLPRPSPI